MATDVAVYVHVPFCIKRCTYCDFTTFTGMLNLRAAYIEAVLDEIAIWAQRFPTLHANTLYFGGGTPSLLPPSGIAAIIAAVQREFGLPGDAEITLEANPGAIDLTLLSDFHTSGVNRLSLGAQSASEHELEMLGRIHHWNDVVEGVRAARTAGFDNVSLDLIFGLPGQTLNWWWETLRRTLDLTPEHLSLYALTLEPGAPLAENVALGKLPEPDPDLAAEMYETASELLKSAGFWQYEISNWAQGTTPPPEIWALPPGGQTEQIGPWVSQHNLSYWRNTGWLGLGVGAHSFLFEERWSNLPHPVSYISAIHSHRPYRISEELITREIDMAETMMMGLRLAEGVTEERFDRRFGVPIRESYGQTIQKFEGLELLEHQSGTVRLTPKGRLLGNQVFAGFLL